MMRITYTQACLLIHSLVDWENAYWKGHGACLAVVHDLCKHAGRQASATVGFAAGVAYGVRREREKKEKARLRR